MIPAIHHLIWTTPDDFSAKYHEWRLSWMRNNPGWDFCVWRLSELPYHRFPQMCTDVLLNDKVHWVMKTDVIRWLVLWLYGGVYSDTDVECVKSMDRFLHDECFTGRSYVPTNIGNAVVGSAQDHPLMLKIAIATAASIAADVKKANESIAEHTVILAGKMLEKCPSIYPAEYFYPFSWGQRKEGKNKPTNEYPQAYCVHHWTGLDADGWIADSKKVKS
jgi:mannosyltransferase OCH1-like enzyme